MNNKYLELAEMAGAKTSLMTNSYKDFLKLYFELIEEHLNEMSRMRDEGTNPGNKNKGRRSNP